MTRAVIVGSGMSGLTAAAYLARDGCEVDVFEQADHIGGVTATLRKEGFAWDLGPLMVEGFAPDEPTGKLLAELGCADRVQFVRGDIDYPVWLGGYFANGEAPQLSRRVPMHLSSPAQRLAPARRMQRSVSSMTRSSSIQPRSAAALIIAYSPDTL